MPTSEPPAPPLPSARQATASKLLKGLRGITRKVARGGAGGEAYAPPREAAGAWASAPAKGLPPAEALRQQLRSAREAEGEKLLAQVSRELSRVAGTTRRSVRVELLTQEEGVASAVRELKRQGYQVSRPCDYVTGQQWLVVEW